jgi:hypothetical protein
MERPEPALVKSRALPVGTDAGVGDGVFQSRAIVDLSSHGVLMIFIVVKFTVLPEYADD